MERLPTKIFEQFQEAKITQDPRPKCKRPLYVYDTCYPLISEGDCHKCGIAWDRNRKK